MSTLDNINQMGTTPSAPASSYPPAPTQGYSGGNSGGYSSQPASGYSAPRTNGNLPPMLSDNDPLFPIAPQLAVSFFIPKETPAPITDKVKALYGSLLRSRFSVRYKLTGEPAMDLPMIGALNEIRPGMNTIEIITPFGEFGKEYLPRSPLIVRTGYQAKRVTASLYQDWAELKPGIRIFRATETHLLLGKSGVSPCIALITWSNDGAESLESLTQETKYNKHVYRLSKMFNIPIINLSYPNAVERLEQILGRYPFVAP